LKELKLITDMDLFPYPWVMSWLFYIAIENILII